MFVQVREWQWWNFVSACRQNSGWDRKFCTILISSREKQAPSRECPLQQLLEVSLNRLHRPHISEVITTYASLLRSCSNARSLSDGRRVQLEMMKAGLEQNTFLDSLLVQMYGRCADLKSARATFDRMHGRNVFSWNFLIGAYARHGSLKEVFFLFEEMQMKGMIPDKVTFVSILSACASQVALTEGKQMHVRILQIGAEAHVIVATALVNMYGNCNMEDAWSTFHKMPDKDVVSWNTIITLYAQQGHGKEAFQFFRQIQQEAVAPDNVTFVGILCACTSPTELIEGKRIHTRIEGGEIKSHIAVATAIMNMYGKCSSLDDARRIFDSMSERNVITWNAMIAGYAQQGRAKEALELFHQMEWEGLVADKVTCVSVVDAYASKATLSVARYLHTFIVNSAFDLDVVVGTALVDMYSKCGSIEDARRVFALMPEKNRVSWNAMISGYAQQGHGKEAFQLFEQMQKNGWLPDKLTIIGMLSACVCQAALIRGRDVHFHVVHMRFELDIVVGNAILNMYGKCGSVEDAHCTFDTMPIRNVVSWNSIIASYAQHGYEKDAFKLFFQMQQQGLAPNEVTFINVLRACSHTGLVDEGFYLLVSMQDNGILPMAEQFDCMLDLLGRSGQLDEMVHLINQMPFQPSVVSWGTVLGPCGNQVDVVQGECAATHMFELNPGDKAPYISFLKIYTEACMKSGAQKIMDNIIADLSPAHVVNKEIQ